MIMTISFMIVSIMMMMMMIMMIMMSPSQEITCAIFDSLDVRSGM